MIYRSMYDNNNSNHDGCEVKVINPRGWPDPYIDVECITTEETFTAFREEVSES